MSCFSIFSRNTSKRSARDHSNRRSAFYDRIQPTPLNSVYIVEWESHNRNELITPQEPTTVSVPLPDYSQTYYEAAYASTDYLDIDAANDLEDYDDDKDESYYCHSGDIYSTSRQDRPKRKYTKKRKQDDDEDYEEDKSRKKRRKQKDTNDNSSDDESDDVYKPHQRRSIVKKSSISQFYFFSMV